MRDAIAGDRRPPSTGIDAVFFDAGFTLLRTTVPVAVIYREAAETLGLPFREEPFLRRLSEGWELRTRGHFDPVPGFACSDEIELQGWRAHARWVSGPFPEIQGRFEAWSDCVQARFDAVETWEPMPGALDVLSALADRGIAIGIVSNWHTRLHAILDRHHIARRVRFVLTSAEAGRRKPHPDIFALALARAGAAPARTLHVGDSVHDDVGGASASGIRALLFRPGGGEPGAEAATPAHGVIGDLSEVLSWI